MRLLPHSLLALISVALGSAEQTCTSQSLPNPIASLYPANVTGTINGTMAILPLPMALARSLIPAQYTILTDSYRKLLPNFPDDMYPAVLQAMYDHDVGFGDYKIADFSRTSIEFPFLDLLHDGSTPFRWVPSMFLTSTNVLGINASREYGSAVYPAVFDPPCDAYAPASSSPRLGEEGEEEETYFSAQASSSGTSLSTRFSPTTAAALPLSFFKAAMHQPVFGDGQWCNAQTRLFSTALTTGPHAPRPVSADVRVTDPVFGREEMVWRGAVGVQLDTPFIERHLVACEELRGYMWEDEEERKGVEVMEAAAGDGFVVVANATAEVGQSPVGTLGAAMMKAYAVTPANGVSY